MAELLARIGSQELTEWMAYDAVEPIGQARIDVVTGMIVHAVLAAAGAKGLGLTECMPKWDWTTPRTAKELEQQVLATFEQLGMKR